MNVREGYDEGAARAMHEAHRGEPSFEERKESFLAFTKGVRKADMFFGIFDKFGPVGAVVFMGEFVHAAVLPRARKKLAHAAMRQCVDTALTRIPRAVARFREDNVGARKLAQAMGFNIFTIEAPYWVLYDKIGGCHV